MAMVMLGSAGVRNIPGAHSAGWNVDPVPTKRLLPGRLGIRMRK